MISTPSRKMRIVVPWFAGQDAGGRFSDFDVVRCELESMARHEAVDTVVVVSDDPAVRDMDAGPGIAALYHPVDASSGEDFPLPPGGHAALEVLEDGDWTGPVALVHPAKVQRALARVDAMRANWHSDESCNWVALSAPEDHPCQLRSYLSFVDMGYIHIFDDGFEPELAANVSRPCHMPVPGRDLETAVRGYWLASTLGQGAPERVEAPEEALLRGETLASFSEDGRCRLFFPETGSHGAGAAMRPVGGSLESAVCGTIGLYGDEQGCSFVLGRDDTIRSGENVLILTPSYGGRAWNYTYVGDDPHRLPDLPDGEGFFFVIAEKIPPMGGFSDIDLPFEDKYNSWFLKDGAVHNREQGEKVFGRQNFPSSYEIDRSIVVGTRDTLRRAGGDIGRGLVKGVPFEGSDGGAECLCGPDAMAGLNGDGRPRIPARRGLTEPERYSVFYSMMKSCGMGAVGGGMKALYQIASGAEVPEDRLDAKAVHDVSRFPLFLSLVSVEGALVALGRMDDGTTAYTRLNDAGNGSFHKTVDHMVYGSCAYGRHLVVASRQEGVLYLHDLSDDSGSKVVIDVEGDRIRFCHSVCSLGDSLLVSCQGERSGWMVRLERDGGDFGFRVSGQHRVNARCLRVVGGLAYITEIEPTPFLSVYRADGVDGFVLLDRVLLRGYPIDIIKRASGVGLVTTDCLYEYSDDLRLESRISLDDLFRLHPSGNPVVSGGLGIPGEPLFIGYSHDSTIYEARPR